MKIKFLLITEGFDSLLGSHINLTKMKQQKIETNELEFVRTLKAIKGEEEVSFIAQPYITGMYVIINNNPSMQFSIEHKKFGKWIASSIKKMEKNGFVVEATKRKYVDFLKEEDITNYDLFKKLN